MIYNESTITLGKILEAKTMISSIRLHFGKRESPLHYSFEWRYNVNDRVELMNAVSMYTTSSVKTILQCDGSLDYQTNF